MELDDVDLSDKDVDHISHLSDLRDFSKSEAEAIVRFARVDRDDRDPDQIRGYLSDESDGEVPPETCAAMRREMSKATRPTTVIDRYKDKHPSVVFRHATGRCDHDVDADPTTSPRIRSDECREMRVDFQLGDTVDDIRTTYNRSANAVVKHVFGRCDHAFDRKRGNRELSPSLCGRMRRVYRENETTSVSDIASAFFVGASTAHRHLSGECGHRDVGEAAVRGDGKGDIDDAECGQMRDDYDGTRSIDGIASGYDRDPATVRRHVFGRCRHGDSRFDPPQKPISSDRCDDIRDAYRDRGDEPVSSLVDRLGVSRGTLYYHAYGDCTHDGTVPPVARD